MAGAIIGTFMTETKYLKIISDLFKLTGYAKGIIYGLSFQDNEDNKDIICEATIGYLEEQQNLILKQLDGDDE